VRHDGAPLRGRRIAHVDGDDAATRRCVGSLKVEFVAFRADEAVQRIPPHEQRLRLGAGLAQILHEGGIRLVAVE
jgi:hypothetical protein